MENAAIIFSIFVFNTQLFHYIKRNTKKKIMIAHNFVFSHLHWAMFMCSKMLRMCLHKKNSSEYYMNMILIWKSLKLVTRRKILIMTIDEIIWNRIEEGDCCVFVFVYHQLFIEYNKLKVRIFVHVFYHFFRDVRIRG